MVLSNTYLLANESHVTMVGLLFLVIAQPGYDHHVSVVTGSLDQRLLSVSPLVFLQGCEQRFQRLFTRFIYIG